MGKNIFFIWLFLITGMVYADAEFPPLHICTMASHEVRGLKQLKRTCRHFNIDLDILGLGLPYKGHGQKLTYWKKYLENIPDQDIVLFVDGYDILFLADKQTILTKFLNMKAQCVISAERQLAPHKYLRDRFPPSPTKFKYLNSGSIISYAGYMKHILEAISPFQEANSDQGQIMLYYIDHQHEIVLDHHCELFLTLLQLKMDDLKLDCEKQTVQCLMTGTQPCIVHGNGKGNRLYQKVYYQLFCKNPGKS